MHLRFPSNSALNTDIMKLMGEGKGKAPVHILQARRGGVEVLLHEF
jgi:hypothetical protein